MERSTTLGRVPFATPRRRLRKGTGNSLIVTPFHHTLMRHSGFVKALSDSSVIDWIKPVG